MELALETVLGALVLEAPELVGLVSVELELGTQLVVALALEQPLVAVLELMAAAPLPHLERGPLWGNNST